MRSDRAVSRPDRRVRRTRQLLLNALLELVQEKCYDKITIQDILERADVGRSTFYAHFHDKDDLLRGNFANMWAKEVLVGQTLRNAAENAESNSILVVMQSLFEHARENYDLYEALRGSEGITSLLAEVRNGLQDIITLRIQQLRPDLDEKQQRLTVHFLSEGLMATMLYWLEQEPTMPAEVVDAQLQRLMLRGLDGM